MERSQIKTVTGTVVSDSMDKTIVVEVATSRAHKLYGKRITTHTKFKAHDEKNEAKVGDRVKIASTRPYSKTKAFRLVEIKEA